MTADPSSLASFYTWITNEFFQKILQKDHNSKYVVVTSFELHEAIGKGQNYGSDLLRATVHFSVDGAAAEQIKLIVKTAISTNPAMAVRFAEMGLFRKEITAYDRLLPEVEKRLRSIGDNSKLVPKCYYSNLVESYLVFEDLSNVNRFENVSKADGLDFKHCRLVLSKIARWHAVTAVLLIEDPSLADNYQETPFQGNAIASMHKNIMTSVAAVAKKIGRFALSESIEKFSNIARIKAISSAERIENGLNVINHGDLWSNNIMYRHDIDGDATDVRLVDFQCCYWGSPLLDVINVLVTSSHKTLRLNDWNKLIEYYHGELTSVLTCLDYQRSRSLPSLDDLLVERRRCGYYSLPMAFLSLALRNMDECDDDGNSVGKFMADSDEDRIFREKIIGNPSIRENFEFLLDYYEQGGFFE